MTPKELAEKIHDYYIEYEDKFKGMDITFIESLLSEALKEARAQGQEGNDVIGPLTRRIILSIKQRVSVVFKSRMAHFKKD